MPSSQGEHEAEQTGAGQALAGDVGQRFPPAPFAAVLVGQSSLTSSCAHCHGAEDRVLLPAGTWSHSCWSAGLFSPLRLRGRGRQACSVESRTRTNRGEFRGPLPVLGASSRNTGSVPPSTAVLTALTKGVQKSWRSSQKNLGTFACPLIPADKLENAELVFLHALCSGC